MATYCYVYALRSGSDGQFYVGLTRDLRARLQAHNKGHVPSTKRRVPLELVYWEGCLNDRDAALREKYLKSAWGKRYLKGRLRRYLTGHKSVETTQIYTHAMRKSGLGVKSPLDNL